MKNMLTELFVPALRIAGTPGMNHFRLKEGCEAQAYATWKEHGVCLNCLTRAVSNGQCKMCGHDMAKAADAFEKAAMEGKEHEEADYA